MNNIKELEHIVISCTLEEHKILEDIVEKSIEEMEEIEAENAFKEYEEMKPEVVDNIMKEILKTRSEVLTNRSVSMDSEGKILKVAERNNEGIKSIDAKYNKTTYALFALFFLLGTLVGLQDEFWKPYISDILSGAKAFATWGR